MNPYKWSMHRRQLWMWCCFVSHRIISNPLRFRLTQLAKYKSIIYLFIPSVVFVLWRRLQRILLSVCVCSVCRCLMHNEQRGLSLWKCDWSEMHRVHAKRYVVRMNKMYFSFLQILHVSMCLYYDTIESLLFHVVVVAVVLNWWTRFDVTRASFFSAWREELKNQKSKI